MDHVASLRREQLEHVVIGWRQACSGQTRRACRWTSRRWRSCASAGATSTSASAPPSPSPRCVSLTIHFGSPPLVRNRYWCSAAKSTRSGPAFGSVWQVSKGTTPEEPVKKCSFIERFTKFSFAQEGELEVHLTNVFSLFLILEFSCKHKNDF